MILRAYLAVSSISGEAERSSAEAFLKEFTVPIGSRWLSGMPA